MKCLLILSILALLTTAAYGKLKVFIVYSHPEPQSFCAAMKDTCVKTLKEQGHEVQVTDIYDLKMFNRIDKTDFVELYDPTYFRPQVEQANANKNGRTNFVEEIRKECDKSVWADVILFIYPYYLSYMPGVMQGWSERVFSYGFAFGPEGNKLKGKKGMLIYTTGGAKEWVHDAEQIMQFLIHDRMKFWQMEPLEAFGAYAVAYVDDETRKKYLADLRERMIALNDLDIKTE